MGFLGKAIRGGIALTAVQAIRRQAAKPENQRKAKELWNKASERRKKPPQH